MLHYSNSFYFRFLSLVNTDSSTATLYTFLKKKLLNFCFKLEAYRVVWLIGLRIIYKYVLFLSIFG